NKTLSSGDWAVSSILRTSALSKLICGIRFVPFQKKAIGEITVNHLHLRYNRSATAHNGFRRSRFDRDVPRRPVLRQRLRSHPESTRNPDQTLQKSRRHSKQ